jgi:FMN phosphatase YigB (HAD superfamily)
VNLTILIDLDDTLLENPLESFMPAYLKLIGNALSSKIDPAKMIPQMLKATDKMIANQDFRETLESCFDKNFYPAFNITKKDVASIIDHFYKTKYLSLQQFTHPRSDAIEFVKQSLHVGNLLVVATNPLFPLQAMKERLRWANLPLEEYPFSLVTSYETLHFAKPNPAYYAEILAQLGWPEAPVCMIGNSISEDIQPTAKLGISAFLLSEKSNNHANLPHGSFDQAAVWLKTVAANNSFSLNYSSIDSILAFLRSSPAALDTILKQNDPTALNTSPSAGEWSVLEVICHLRDVENDVNVPRLQKVIYQNETFIPAIDSDRWAKERNYQAESIQTALNSYLTGRANLIDLIQNLDVTLLNRTINHSIFGPTKVQELLQFIIRHDQEHLRQIKKTLNLLSTNQ